jgi:hypothetical protein
MPTQASNNIDNPIQIRDRMWERKHNRRFGNIKFKVRNRKGHN